jgi:hypothetical protein
MKLCLALGLILFTLAPVSAVSPLLANYCEYFFRTHTSEYNVQPLLNVDKTYRRIESYKELYKNELRITAIGNAEGEKILRIDLTSPNPNAKKILITGGVHGNEPFGVTTSLELLEKLVYNRELREQYEFVFFPMLNPAGLKQNVRRTLEGIDPNRSFKPGAEIQMTKLLKQDLAGEEFTLAMDLHGAVLKHGFFVIKANKHDGGLAIRALDEIDPAYLLTSADGQYPFNIPMLSNPNKTAYILYSPGETVSLNAGTVKDFFYSELNIKRAYTLEYPGQISTFERQDQYVKLVESFIKNQ